MLDLPAITGALARRRTGARRLVGAALCVAVAATLSSCTSYMRDAPFIKSSLANHDFEKALNRLEKVDKGSSELLYLYEKGLILHYQNRLVESNEVLEKAEILYEDLYTKSLTREIGSLLTSDTVIKYRGDRFESALIHYYKILNYLYLGEPEGALVECRKLNQKLKMFSDDEGNRDYPGDPFLQYLTALVYEAMREYNDADVSLRLALDSYDGAERWNGVSPPPELACDLVRSAERLGDREAAERYRSDQPCDGTEMTEGSGVLHLFIESGYVAHKIEQNIVLPIYKDEYRDDLDPDEFSVVLYDRYGRPVNTHRKVHYLLRVAIPVLVDTPYPNVDMVARVVDGDESYRSYAHMVEYLDVLAANAFDARKGQIMVKTIARGLAKYLAKEGAEEKEGEVAGMLVNILNVATETADVRSWTTLPRSIRMARLVLPEGVHDVEIVLFDVYGQPSETIVIPEVEIHAGLHRFMNYRIF